MEKSTFESFLRTHVEDLDLRDFQLHAELVNGKDLKRWENERRLPFQAKLAGGLSIVLWIAVVACGRWIGFTMLVR